MFLEVPRPQRSMVVEFFAIFPKKAKALDKMQVTSPAGLDQTSLARCIKHQSDGTCSRYELLQVECRCAPWSNYEQMRTSKGAENWEQPIIKQSKVSFAHENPVVGLLMHTRKYIPGLGILPSQPSVPRETNVKLLATTEEKARRLKGSVEDEWSYITHWEKRPGWHSFSRPQAGLPRATKPWEAKGTKQSFSRTPFQRETELHGWIRPKFT